MIKNFEQLFDFIKGRERKKIVVPRAESKSIVEACNEAHNVGLADSILIGDGEKILDICKEAGVESSIFDIVDESDDVNAVKKAIDIVNEGRASMIMKGKTDTATLLKEVLSSESGLKRGRVLSHIAVVEVKNYHKLMVFTDGGLNIYPDLDKRIDIIKNAVEFEKKLGNSDIKVALLTAVEKVNEKIKETLVYDKIVKMQKSEKFVDAVVEGPVAMDIALDSEAAKIKDYKGKIPGDVDIFVTPDIASCNIVVKSLIYLANAKVGGLVVGAKVPIVLLSRSDTPDTKLRSIALGALWENVD